MSDIKELKEEDLEKVTGGTVWVVKRVSGNVPTTCPVQGCSATLTSYGDINGFPCFFCTVGHDVRIWTVSETDKQTQYATAYDNF